jgi:hypothetical protein
MISNTSPRHASKTRQLDKFLDAPTPESFLEPSHERSCDTHRVRAERQKDGGFRLFARSPTQQLRPVAGGDLHEFLDEMIQELPWGQGDSQAMRNLGHLIGQCKKGGYAPSVAELRQVNAELHAQWKADHRKSTQRPASEYQIRNRARFTSDRFVAELQQQLEALPQNDSRRGDLEQAGDQLAYMLFQPDATLSLKGISPETLDLLISTGLMDSFSNLRDGAHPTPVLLILPAHAKHLHGRLPDYLAACKLALC